MDNIISFSNLGLEFTINRIMFSIGNFSVYWYGAIIAFGLILALLYGARESKRVGLSSDDYFNMVLFSIPTSIICARVYYVLFSLDLYMDDWMSAFNIRNGGLAIYGSIIGAFIVIFTYCKKKNLSIGLVLDILAIGLLIGQSIGRWGNFVNGEAFGYHTTLPWAMTITSNGRTIAESVHPTFLYESLWNALGILILCLYKKHRKFNGEVFCGYMILYGIGRMLIEGLRADSLYLGAVRVSQLLSLLIFIAGATLIILGRKKAAKKI